MSNGLENTSSAPASSSRKPPPRKDNGNKKFNPTQLRQHIRALIDGNFDNDTEGYDSFLKEVEEQGF